MHPSLRRLAAGARTSGASSGFHPALPGRGHVFLAKALGATMWFFIFYRMREDGPALLGLRHPWEGHGHDSHHGESH